MINLLDVVVELWNIGSALTVAQQVLREVVGHTPEEVLVHIAETVTLAWEKEHIEALVCTNQRINNTQRVTRMNVLVDIAVNQQEVALEA